MKKQLFLSMFAIVAVAGTAMAQETLSATTTTTTTTTSTTHEGYQQKTPEERTKEAVLKIVAELGVTNDQAAKTNAVFMDFYKGMQAAMESVRAGTTDRDQFKASRDELSAIRDKRLSGILTADQMTKWTTVVEPSMHQRKPQQ